MSYKFDSLLLVLNKLDAAEIVTNASLMDELEISERSAYRYMQSLMIAGFPIWYDRKRRSYAFAEDFQLRSRNASPEEELAFSLARRFMAPMGGEVAKGLDSLEKRLAAPATETVNPQILFADYAIPATVQQHLVSLHRAIRDNLVVEITYPSSTTAEASVRSVDPLYLFTQDNFWYLRALCHQADGLRTFSLDRIASLRITAERFRPYSIDGEEELSSAFGPMLDGELTEVVLRFDAESAGQVLRRKWHPSQKEAMLADGRVEICFKVTGTEGVKNWLYRWLPGVEVIAPEELRKLVVEELSLAMRKHGGKYHA